MNALTSQEDAEQITNLNTAQMTQMFAQAPVFQKSATVTIRYATPGERVTTTLASGHEETAITCDGGEPVITNPGGEQYVPQGGWAQVERRYRPLNGDRWQARGMVRAIVNPSGQPVTIMAPWGEKQRGTADCLFAVEYLPAEPDVIGPDRYIIGAEEFAQTYRPAS